jgi:hypothetical protein
MDLMEWRIAIGFNWSYEWKLFIAKTIISNSKCELLQINDRNGGFLAMQVSIDEWWSGQDDDNAMPCDNG